MRKRVLVAATSSPSIYYNESPFSSRVEGTKSRVEGTMSRVDFPPFFLFSFISRFF